MVEPWRGERSEREGRPVAALRPRRTEPYLLLGPPRPPPICGLDLVHLVVLRGPAPAPGIRVGVVSGGAGCRVLG